MKQYPDNSWGRQVAVYRNGDRPIGRNGQQWGFNYFTIINND